MDSSLQTQRGRIVIVIVSLVGEIMLWFGMYLLCSESVFCLSARGKGLHIVWLFDRKGNECKFRINFTDGARLRSLPLWESARARTLKQQSNSHFSVRTIWFFFPFGPRLDAHYFVWTLTMKCDCTVSIVWWGVHACFFFNFSQLVKLPFS